MSDALVSELRKKFSRENLGRITQKLIEIYRAKDFAAIERAYRAAVKNVPDVSLRDDPQKIFTFLIKIYHPDRSSHYLHQITEFETQKNEHALKSLRNLADVTFERTKRPPGREVFRQETADIYPDEENWMHGREDFDAEYDFEETDETGEADEAHEEALYEEEDREEDGEPGAQAGEEDFSESRGFVFALRAEEPGLQDVEITPALLETLSGSLDLSGYEIDEIEGLGFCVHLDSLNLSNNSIENIEELSSLTELEELYLSGNRISDLSPLAPLHYLRDLDLSFNEIDDVSALYGLPALSYVNLAGNPVKKEEVQPLLEKGIIVIL